MSNRRAIQAFTAQTLFSVFICAAGASENDRTCYGNLETFNKQIIQAKVTYKLSYEIQKAAGRPSSFTMHLRALNLVSNISVGIGPIT
ncbi:hypothetical protein [Methylovulum miyakonense]|uniref:hypothetical protein n=1 Tax=Methylovulum miyakonense TaxID=645578 RepID=UPI003BB6EF21